ncbi:MULTISPECIES: sterol desaturase family protein [Bradyrhizobium]|nr:hypothetical protein [Bradyrhizobium elkanii]WLA86932.1 hypothetical protein QNJ99_05815 [Bradyrhizobium elkanii]
MHHSRHQPETDSNYSNLLSIWDRLGGTYNRGLRASRSCAMASTALMIPRSSRCADC